MHVLWGALMVVIGLLMVAGASLKSEFIIYRLLVARSRMLWGDKVHLFHQIAGTPFFGNCGIHLAHVGHELSGWSGFRRSISRQ